MKRSCVIWLIVLGLFVLSGLAQAQNGNGQTGESTTEKSDDSAASKKDKEEPTVMKEVVVTATRYAEEVETVPTNVTVITKEDIVNSTAQDVPGVLSTAGGVHVTDVTGNRRSYKVDLRGFGETAQSNTLVLVDGRRTNQPDLSGTDWTLIPLDRVERIEIVRGSRGSVLYGDNAAGGVVNIITKEGDKFGAGANIAGGSYDTFKGDAYISGSKNNFSYALSGSYYDSDGYRENSATLAKDLGVNLGYLVGDFMKLTLNSGYHKDETGLPGALRLSELEAGIPRTASVYPDNFAETEDGYVGLIPEVFFLQDSLFKMPLSYRNREFLAFASFVGGTFEGDTEIKTTMASPQFIFREPVFGFNNNLTFGLDYTKAKDNIVNTVVGLFPSTGEFDLEKKNYGVYIHDEFYPISNLALSAGFRYDKVDYEFRPSDPDNASYNENPFTAGINYQFLQKSYLYFSFSEGFRYPVLDELFDFFSNTINASLRPQTSKNYETGVRHYFTQSLYTNINLFRLDTKDEIYFNPTGGPFGFGVNENFDGKTRRDGVEISLGKTFKRVSLRGTYTYTNAEVLDGRFAGNEVPGVPKHMATFDLLFDLGRGFNFIFNGVYVGERFLESDWANAFPEQDDYLVFNAKLKYKWKKITAYFDVNNIFDEEYASFGVLSQTPVEPAFFPSPERNFLVGVRFDY